MIPISPEILNALTKFGLITDEQADDEFARWERKWDWDWEDARWWVETANIAWWNQASIWQRIYEVWTPPSGWCYDWIKEKRGW